MKQEIWKDIPKWEGYYQASNFGRIRSVTRQVWIPANKQGKGYFRTYSQKIINPKKENNGYLRLTLWRDRKYKIFSVHVLIAITWFNYVPRSNFCINHKNGIKIDNSIENLEIVTYKQNMQHALKTGLRKVGFSYKGAVLTKEQGQEIFDLRKNGYTLRQIATLYKVSRRAVENAIKWISKFN